jgi:hypothetical protein
MAATSKFYGQFWKTLANKELNMNTDTFKLALFTSSLTPNQDTHIYYDAAPYTSNQVANGAGYTTGGVTVSPITVSYDAATNKVSFAASNATWTTATFTARYGVLYDNTPTTNKPLVLYVDFGADQSPSNGTFSITWDAAGIGYVQTA